MHNWYEGVLQHHWCVHWEFDPKASKYTTQNDQLDDWEDNDSDSSHSTQDFQDSALAHIRHGLQNILVPCGVTQVPPNLADPKHSKLKASKWHSLFSTYLPLTLITVFVKNPAQCVPGSLLSEAYRLYTKTSKLVFDSPKIVPNHHYALHLPEQLKWWGYLLNFSDFAGKQINGILQKFQTNLIVGQLEGTVMQEFCQVQRLQSQTSG
ncbi:hypothetical protein PGTUg99_029670 [Puccinia graminis f. sp. tritici]|nr:hypothetical protein PGTUg99_029670 [Puccinia graminis f. sp. tritici]